MLTACDLNSLLPSGGNNQPAESRESSSVDVKKLAFKVADFVSVFPEVGDELDMSDYVQYDAGTGYKLEDFTFESTKPDVISIANYKGQCLKEGYCGIKVGHPDLGDKKIEVGFWVGSIAGTYKPDNRRLSSLINFTIGEVNSERMSDFTLTINEGTFRNENVKAYNGSGQLFKNGTPFLTLNFEGTRPANFSPISSYLSVLGVELDGDYAAITDSVYGLMSYDVELGVSIRTIFMGEIVEFFAE